MIPRKLALAAFALLSLSAALAAPYEVVRAVSTGPAVIGVPWKQGAPPKVFMRVEKGKWVPADFSAEGDALTFRLDPAELGSGNVVLIINPPAGLVLDDNQGPAFADVKVDGKPVRAGARVDLGKVKEAPRRVEVTARDRANAVDALQVTLDGKALPERAVRVEQAGRQQACVTVRLRDVEYGPHELALTASDTAPEPNQSTMVLSFELLDFGNVALGSMGARVAVDSSFPDYDRLEILNNGITTMPGDSVGPDISWASAEVAADHWAEVTLPKPTEIKEVSVYWAAYTHTTHTPQYFEIQVPDNGGWRAVYQSPAAGEPVSRVSTARFEPVKAEKFRVFMPAGKGSVSRPNLLWIGEIKAR